MAYEVKPFESGVLMALASLTYALKKSPGFDSSALDEAAQFFRDVPAGIFLDPDPAMPGEDSEPTRPKGKYMGRRQHLEANEIQAGSVP
jgi:hypothetical protein